jgi:hypothetical protein
MEIGDDFAILAHLPRAILDMTPCTTHLAPRVPAMHEPNHSSHHARRRNLKEKITATLTIGQIMRRVS